MFSSANAAVTPSEYELEGFIDQTCYYGGVVADLKIHGEFKVFVRGGSWLIQTIETKQGAKTKEYLKREIGSTNGAEIVEIVTTLRTNNRSSNIATLVSNAVPVGQMDGSVVGHLWLMLASHGYLSGLKTNLLTPVYDVSASAPGNPDLKRPAKWELLAGLESLPQNVTYFDDNGTALNAVYRAIGATNVDGVAYPTGFLFERYGETNFVIKRATASVTAIRPVCSLASLLPAVTGKTVVVDRRLAHTDQPIKRLTYRATPNAELPSIAEAKKAYDRKKNPPNHSPVVLALILVTFCLPLVAGGIHFWRRRGKAG